MSDKNEAVELPNDPGIETLHAYEKHVEQYVERTPTTRSSLVDDLIRHTEPGERILELGSGPGRDADDLEAAGLIVDRTDGALSFVDRLRASGHSARVLNFYAADFGGPYDAVFANAVFLHIPRARLSGVLDVTRRATRVGGLVAASFKRGTGEAWSEQKLDSRRHFTYWEPEELRAVMVDARWTPLEITDSTHSTSSENWITVLARNSES